MKCTGCDQDYPQESFARNSRKCNACKAEMWRKRQRDTVAKRQVVFPLRVPRRTLISDMDLPENARACMYGFWTDRPCPHPATWTALEESNQWRACDMHRHLGDVPLADITDVREES